MLSRSVRPLCNTASPWLAWAVPIRIKVPVEHSVFDISAKSPRFQYRRLFGNVIHIGSHPFQKQGLERDVNQSIVPQVQLRVACDIVSQIGGNTYSPYLLYYLVAKRLRLVAQSQGLPRCPTNMVQSLYGPLSTSDITSRSLCSPCPSHERQWPRSNHIASIRTVKIRYVPCNCTLARTKMHRIK